MAHEITHAYDVDCGSPGERVFVGASRPWPSGVDRNVNLGGSPLLPPPSPPFPLSPLPFNGDPEYNPRNFFLKLKVLCVLKHFGPQN